MAKQPEPVHQPGTTKGEHVPRVQGQSGRYTTGRTGQANRLAGKSTPSDATGINPKAERPIDPQSPYLPPA